MLAYNCGCFVDILSWVDFGPRGEAQQSRHWGNRARRKIKNITNEASMLLKTNVTINGFRERS